MTKAAVRSKAVVPLLLIYCLMYFPLFVGVILRFYLFCYALLCVHSIFAIILKRKRNLVDLLLLSYRYIVTINVLWLFFTVSWVGLQCVIDVFPNHTQLLFVARDRSANSSILHLWRVFRFCTMIAYGV